MFKLIDPLGFEIILTKECWRGHILIEHPIMKRFLFELKELIVNPDYIFKSKVGKKSILYFKKFVFKRFGRFYLMAAAGRDLKKKKGYIKTSFPVYNLTKGGEILWKRV